VAAHAGTWCRDLGRQATAPEDPVDHGRLVDRRDQTQAVATGAPTDAGSSPLWSTGGGLTGSEVSNDEIIAFGCRRSDMKFIGEREIHGRRREPRNQR
jgi:hypothetical protein